MAEECSCKRDIFTDHAPLIHTARDIIFYLAYKNGTLDASIIDIDQKNVQMAMEFYFSKTGLPITGEHPTGIKNNQNLIYVTDNEFIPSTLQVNLSGNTLNGNQLDPDRDYDIITSGPNTNKGFVLRLEPNKAHRLNKPPQQYEGLFVNYGKRITFNTKGGN